MLSVRVTLVGLPSILAAALAAALPWPVVAQNSPAPMFYDQRRLPDMEVERRNQEVLNEQRRQADERRLEAETQARRKSEASRLAEEKRIAAEAEARKKADDEKRIAAEAEARKKAEDEKRIAAEAEARKKAEDEKRIAAEAEARKKAEDEKRIAAEAEARKKAEDEKRIAAEAEARKKADEEKRIAAEAEARKKAEDEKRIAAEAEARKKAEDEKRIAAEAEARKKADEEKRIAAEAEARKKADQEKRIAAEAEARKKTEDEKRIAAEAEAGKKADQEKRIAAEAEAKRSAEENRLAALAASAQKAANDEKKRAAAAAAPAPVPPAQPQRGQSQTAALAPSVTNAIIAGPGKGGTGPGTRPCEAPMTTRTPLPGGRLQIAIDSPCRHDQAVTMTYGGYSFIRALDAGGKAELVLDLFLGRTQTASLDYADGLSVPVDVGRTENEEISKVAIIWQSPVNLDLHAIEGGGTFGKSGHVWAGAPQSAETAWAQANESGRGTGFMSSLDEGSHDGAKIEVYTYLHSPEQDSGAVRMLVDFASRGGMPTGELCGSGKLAEIPFDIVIMDRKGQLTRESAVLPAARCGESMAAKTRYLHELVPDLRFRR